MRITTTLGIILSLAAFSSTGLAQELTTEQVMARLDEKAKVFTSLEASISQAQVVADTKSPVESGKILIKTVEKLVPMSCWISPVLKGLRKLR